MPEPEIVVHRSIGSRSFPVVWLLEEMGVPYRSVMRDLKERGNRAPDYLELNPHGFVPTVVVGDAVVRECPAICAFLADRYSYGTLAPLIEDADRGPYLSWLVYSTAVLEPARGTQDFTIVQRPGGAWGVGWKPLAEVVTVLADAIGEGPWLLGERFSAADIMLGSTLAMGLFTGEIPADPVLAAYNERMTARPACRRAMDLNWPPEVFGRPNG